MTKQRTLPFYVLIAVEPRADETYAARTQIINQSVVRTNIVEHRCINHSNKKDHAGKTESHRIEGEREEEQALQIRAYSTAPS